MIARKLMNSFLIASRTWKKEGIEGEEQAKIFSNVQLLAKNSSTTIQNCTTMVA
jgi:hypothetical protein